MDARNLQNLVASSRGRDVSRPRFLLPDFAVGVTFPHGVFLSPRKNLQPGGIPMRNAFPYLTSALLIAGLLFVWASL